MKLEDINLKIKELLENHGLYCNSYDESIYLWRSRSG